ncbi:MAG: DUF6132 family protein [Kiritimatiellae bacterium]|nr:DUF6132 family protein [Kiritimatiellia bacterium]
MSGALRIVMGAAAGAALGWTVYRFIGCRTGGCPLTSNPWTAMIVWALLGAMLAAPPR